jgi:hypothetical protein
MHVKKFETLRRKVAQEFWQLISLTAYLGVFFCVLDTYSMLLMNQFHIAYFAYGTALVNAVLVAKAILIGEAISLGQRFEQKPVLYSAIAKATMFAWLVFVLHLLEEMIKSLIVGKTVAATFEDIRFDGLLMRTIVILCAFVPLFMFSEMRRAIGRDAFRNILLGSARN